MGTVTVRVPASTSNLGPGFDCLGVALRIYNFITVTRVKEPQSRNNRGSRSVSELHSRIVEEAARLFFKRARKRTFSFSCGISGDVPQSRGLGGSATIRLGVLHALNHLAGKPLNRLSVFHLCTELEEHPDNAAPSSFGGFTISRGQNVQRFEVSPRLCFVLLIPDFEIATSAARRILPSKISRVAGIQGCANACAITAAFASQSYEKLCGTFVDHFHQPFRQRLIPFLPRVVAAAERAGALGGFLSGSGSAICAVTLRNARKIAGAMQRAARSRSSRTFITTADNSGVSINYSDAPLG